MGVSSPMSKTTPKQGSERKWGNIFNVFKTIENQDTERSLAHCANGPMTIGK